MANEEGEKLRRWSATFMNLSTAERTRFNSTEQGMDKLDWLVGLIRTADPFQKFLIADDKFNLTLTSLIREHTGIASVLKENVEFYNASERVGEFQFHALAAIVSIVRYFRDGIIHKDYIINANGYGDTGLERWLDTRRHSGEPRRFDV